LHGDITGGSVSVNEAGQVTAIIAAKLTVEGGNKNYSEIAGGSGVFEGNLQTEGEPPAPPQHALAPQPEGTQARVVSPPSSPADSGPRPGFTGTMTLHF